MSHCCSCCLSLASLLNGCEEYFPQWRPPWRNVHATTPWLSTLRQFVAFTMLFMASNSLLELVLKSLAQLLLSRVSLRVLMTLLCLFEDPLLVSLLFFFMLMIWLLLEMILQVSTLFSTSLVNILRWKIWALLAIFLGLRLPHPLMDTIFSRLNMLLIFSPKSVSPTTRLFPLL